MGYTSRAYGFQKGVVTNPHGQGGLDKSLRPLVVAARNNLIEVYTEFMKKRPDEIRAILTNPESSVFEVMVARVMDRVMVTGDHVALDALLNRIVGKPIQPIELPDDTPPEFRTKSDRDIRQSIIAMLKEAERS